MTLGELPPCAAWIHRGARSGLEIARIVCRPDGLVVEGVTVATEDGESWQVDYRLVLDLEGRSRSATVTSQSSGLDASVELTCDERGRWWANGHHVAQVDGCADVDLGSSALTNAFPVRRLGLRTGDAADAPAVYVRAPDLVVERLDQRYRRLPDEGHAALYEYEAPRFDFACTIRYDETGLVLDYPGIAVRALNAAVR